MSEDLETLLRKSIISAIIIGSLLICVALSREVMAADGVKTGTLSMKRQHEAMETLDRQWSKVRDAVKKGDYAAASWGIMFMEKQLVPDIVKFQPHRHAEKRDQYLRSYEDFVQSLRLLRNAVAAKDAPQAAPGSLKGVEESCKQCHDLFAGGHH